MVMTDRPRFLLPPAAYTSRRWFEREQRRVLDPTWHRGPGGAVVAHWAGMDFSSECPMESLADALGTLPMSIGSVDPGRLTEVARCDLEGRFNWKLFIENHIDVLHLWYLHAETLGMYDHARFDHQQQGRNWVSYEPLRTGIVGPTVDDSAIAHLDVRDRSGLGAHLLFPDTPMALSADFFLTYRARPLAPDRTVVELRILSDPGTDPAPLAATATGFIEEDMEACERIQAVTGSRHFEVGPLALTHEAPLVAFHRSLLDLLEEPAP